MAHSAKRQTVKVAIKPFTYHNSVNKRQKEAPAPQCSIFPCGMTPGKDRVDATKMGETVSLPQTPEKEANAFLWAHGPAQSGRFRRKGRAKRGMVLSPSRERVSAEAPNKESSECRHLV